MKMILFMGLSVMLAVPNASAQESVNAVVAQLLDAGKRYEAALPSLSCEENVISQRLKNGKVKQEVRLEATMQVKRMESERSLFLETYKFNKRDGAPVADGAKFDIPYFVNGAFANSLGFGTRARLACLRVSLRDEPASPILELTTRAREDLQSTQECKMIPPGYVKVVTIDRASGHVTHLLRTVPDKEARRLKDVAYAEVDYAPVALGAETFWLPTRAVMHDGSDEGHMIVSYSGCHRFASTVTITGGTQTVPDPQ